MINIQDSNSIVEAVKPLAAGKANPLAMDAALLLDGQHECEPVIVMRFDAYLANQILVHALVRSGFPIMQFVVPYLAKLSLSEESKVDLFTELGWLLNKYAYSPDWARMEEARRWEQAPRPEQTH
jgi:hypothetical protein